MSAIVNGCGVPLIVSATPDTLTTPRVPATYVQPVPASPDEQLKPPYTLADCAPFIVTAVVYVPLHTYTRPRPFRFITAKLIDPKGAASVPAPATS